MKLLEPKVLCSDEAKPCPWCGKQPHIQPWHGGAATKKLIDCQNEDCAASPSVTGETRKAALSNWNSRA